MSRRVQASLLFAMVVLLWSVSYLGSAAQVAHVPPMIAYAPRLLLGGALLLWPAWRSLRAGGLRRRAVWIEAASIAIFLDIIPGVPTLWALKSIPSGFVAVLYATEPLFAAWMAQRMYGQRIDRRTIPACLVAIIGLWVLSRGSLPHAGDIWIVGVLLVGNAVYAYASVRIGGENQDDSDMALTMALGQVIAGTLCLGGGFGSGWGDWTPPEVTWTLYLAVTINGLGMLLYGMLLRRIGAEAATYTDIVIPVGALVAGVAVAHEPFGPLTLIGSVLTLGAVTLRFANVRRFKESTADGELAA